MCVLGCDKRFARAPVAGNVTFLDLFDAPLGVACGIAGNPFGAALHQRTGVRFHVVSACVGDVTWTRATGESRYDELASAS